MLHESLACAEELASEGWETEVIAPIMPSTSMRTTSPIGSPKKNVSDGAIRAQFVP